MLERKDKEGREEGRKKEMEIMILYRYERMNGRKKKEITRIKMECHNNTTLKTTF